VAYNAQDYPQALKGYYQCLKEDWGSFGPGDAGLVYHRIGNCLIKMRSFKEAAVSYQKALQDESYNEKTSIYVNLGTTLNGIGKHADAVGYFNKALSDASYATPYRAYMGLGSAYTKLGKLIEAGTAYRDAALDEGNPNPVKALSSLGTTFMALERPDDAVEAYLAILDFRVTGKTLNSTLDSLGQAYVAAGRFQEGLNTFEDLLSREQFALSEQGQADFSKARYALGLGTTAQAPLPVDTADPFAGFGEGGFQAPDGGQPGAYPTSGYDSGYGGSLEQQYADGTQGRDGYGAQGRYDDGYQADGAGFASARPGGRAGASSGYDGGYDDGYGADGGYGGGNVPSADDTGFFTATDDDLIATSKRQMRRERKLRHTGLKVFLGFVVVLVLALGAAVAAYWQGFGIPSQESVVTDFFNAYTVGEPIEGYWVSATEEEQKTLERLLDGVARSGKVDIISVNASMASSEVIADVQLVKGGTVHYRIELSRDVLGWKINGIEQVFASNVVE
jgi:tetratricopeptide (TPR) repeat protein